MMLEYIKRVLQVSSVIFTLIVLLELITGHAMNNDNLFELMGVSVTAAAIRFLFFKESLYEQSLLLQVLFLLIVWVMVIGANFVFGWEMALSDIFVNFAAVIAIYFGVKFINYRHDKSETKKMNDYLNKARKK